MKFTPKSEHEIEASNLLPKGTYDFEVVKAEDAQSKKGNEMIKVCLKVFAPNGGTPFVWDYLLEAFLGKLLNFCSATNLMAAYNSGNLTADMLYGKCGKVEIDIEAASDKYKAKNVVVDYVRDSDTTVGVSSGSVSGSDMAEDDIPFTMPAYQKLWFC